MAYPSRLYMIETLLQWNPHWQRATVESWHDRQLFAIYMKELRKQELRQREPKQISLWTM